MTVFRKTTETYTPGAKSLPQKYFVSEKVFALEREQIFRTQWLCVGHQSNIPNPGDYFVPEVLGESLILVRDQKGIVRDYYNVCRHLGTRMCEEKEGHLRETIRCPYRSWHPRLNISGNVSLV